MTPMTCHAHTFVTARRACHDQEMIEGTASHIWEGKLQLDLVWGATDSAAAVQGFKGLLLFHKDVLRGPMAIPKNTSWS